MARTVVALEGSDWMVPDERAHLELWGPISSDPAVELDSTATHEKLFDLWVERFEQIGAEHGFKLAWVPESAMLLTLPEHQEKLDPALVLTWRTQALEEVRSLWHSGGIALVCSPSPEAD
ncbi:MAG: hypothetical protein VKP72_04070 [bacterium]|nr:hypothetical protein [bacterium]